MKVNPEVRDLFILISGLIFTLTIVLGLYFLEQNSIIGVIIIWCDIPFFAIAICIYNFLKLDEIE